MICLVVVYFVCLFFFTFKFGLTGKDQCELIWNSIFNLFQVRYTKFKDREEEQGLSLRLRAVLSICQKTIVTMLKIPSMGRKSGE